MLVFVGMACKMTTNMGSLKIILEPLKDINNGKVYNLKSASNLNGNLNCSKELEHYAS